MSAPILLEDVDFSPELRESIRKEIAAQPIGDSLWREAQVLKLLMTLDARRDAEQDARVAHQALERLEKACAAAVRMKGVTAVICREGNGPEDIGGSVTLTMARLLSERDDAQTATAASQQALVHMVHKSALESAERMADQMGTACETFKAHCLDLEAKLAVAQERIVDLEREVAHLRKFAKHDRACNVVHDQRNFSRCDCGLEGSIPPLPKEAAPPIPAPTSHSLEERLVALLYELMRDCLPTGVVVEKVKSASAGRLPNVYTAKPLEAYARELAAKLKGTSTS